MTYSTYSHRGASTMSVMSVSRRTRKSTSSDMKRRIQATVIAVHGTACAACDRETIVGASPTDGRGFNLGHVVSEANGGEFVMSNLLPICRRCNSYMGESDWSESGAPMNKMPISCDLVKDPGTAQTHMERPFWAK